MFIEEQKFNSNIIIGILILISLLSLATVGLLIFAKLYLISFFPFLFLLLLLYFFGKMKLTTKINSNYIELKFFPFQISQKFFYKDLTNISIVTYDAIKEYGGWGIRIGKSGKAYTVAGNKGLLLHLLNGKRILIGTQKESELIAELKNIDQPQVFFSK